MNIKKAGVIGDPISHSLSPIIHNYLLKKYNIDGEYLPYQVKSKNLETECRKFALNNYKGFNVTLPHKENMFQICDYLSKTASEVKAVNTVIITPDKNYLAIILMEKDLSKIYYKILQILNLKIKK